MCVPNFFFSADNPRVAETRCALHTDRRFGSQYPLPKLNNDTAMTADVDSQQWSKYNLF
jgi:hypothetical protein